MPDGHPETGMIAAHADRRLTGADAARMDAHLAGCSECHEVFAETLRFALDEEAAGVVPLAETSKGSWLQRPAFRLAAVLALAATLAVALQQVWLARSRRGDQPLAELARAMGTTRFVEPRVTGGFEHGRLVVLRSAQGSRGLDAHSPDVVEAVARIRRWAAHDTSPAALGALGVTYLVSSDANAAVAAFESATAQDPENPRLQSDLSAAYLVRASLLDEPADIPKALEAAEKAIEKPDAPVEAWFNRAVALERLHLVDPARKAWSDYLARDSTSGWAAEARRRLEELPPAQSSSLEQDRARAAAALEAGQGAIDALADESPAVLRDYFDNMLLPAWADATLADDPKARVLAERARESAAALVRSTGDAMPRDAADALATSTRGPPRLQALGYHRLREGQRVNDVLLKPSAACPIFRDARRLLESGGSPYSALARERIVVACWYPAEPRAALAELARLETLAKQRAYVHVLGRVHWMEAIFHQHRGEFSVPIDRYRLALKSFQALRDPDGEASVLSRLAGALHWVGEGRAAWREHVRGLALLHQVRAPTRRNVILYIPVVACIDERLLRSALVLETAALDEQRREANALTVAFSYLRRSQTFEALGSPRRASTDLAEARRLIPQVEGGVWARMVGAHADILEGRIVTTTDPSRAVASIERALQYFVETNPGLVPQARLQLARAQRAHGGPDSAERELEAGIRLLESQRASASGTGLRESFFERATALFDEMVTLQLDVRHDPRRALAFVERSRARQLVESLGSSSQSGPSPLGLDAIQRELPEGLALVYYQCLSSRVLIWVLTRDGLQFFDQSLALADLQLMLATYETALVRRASVSVVREHASRLFDALARPVVEAVGTRSTLAFVRDDALESVPFAALWDARRGRYLAEDYVVDVVPSGTVFVRASAAAASPSRTGTQRLLAVGNPRVERARSNLWPTLPGAETEAHEVARLYEDSEVLTGPAATKGAFLDALGRSQVVHFAGHAVSSDTPGAARLLLAPDPGTQASGELHLREIDRQLPRTRVVVLAACRTAAGTPSRLEGGASLATPFLAAGVPNVVASLWNLDDVVSRRFFVEFHASLLREGEPTRALQHTQVSFLRDPDPVLAHPASWAGLVSLGGVALPR